MRNGILTACDRRLCGAPPHCVSISSLRLRALVVARLFEKRAEGKAGQWRCSGRRRAALSVSERTLWRWLVETDPGTSSAVPSAHQVSKLALDLGSGAALVARSHCWAGAGCSRSR